MPGSARRSSTKSPTPMRRTLPSRSSRPLRASMRDGSDVDDVIQEVTRSPTGFRHSPVKPIPKRRTYSSDSDESGPSSSNIVRRPRNKIIPPKQDELDDDNSADECSSMSLINPIPRVGNIKKRRGRPPRVVIEPPKEKEQTPGDSDESEESQASSSADTPPKKRRCQQDTPPEEEEEDEDEENDSNEDVVDEPSSSVNDEPPVSRRRGRLEPEVDDSSESDDSEESEQPTSRRPQIKRARGRLEETPSVESKTSSDSEMSIQQTLKVKQFRTPEKATPIRRPRGRPRKEKPVKAATLNFSEEDSSDNSSSDSSDEGGRFDNETVEAAKALVKSVYVPIMKTNASEMNALFKGFFRDSILKLTVKVYKTKDQIDPVPLNLKPEPVVQGKEISKVKRADRPSPEPPVRCHFIDTQPMKPRMKNWVHIEYNIKTEDNLRLSHIPYVDDEHDSAAFCRELTKAYPEGIHGIRHGWGKHISDYLLYLLLKQAMPQWEETKHEMRYLWRAIYKLFPNKLSARQLVFAYHTLEQRFTTPHGGEDETSKKDDMHHSISTMLCIKCQQFHCLLHGVTSEEFRMHRKPMAKVHSRVEEPCGPDCYRLLTETDEGGEKKRGRRKSLPHFPPTAQMIFQKMIHNNRNPYCQVAIMMASVAPDEIRTCQDIYFMAQALPPPERERSPDDIMKRKISIKEQQSSFRSHSWSNGKGRVDNSEPPKACRHQGPCGQTVDDCYCGQQNTLCSKFCSCGPDCKLRFPGCRCQPGQCRTKSCQCFYAKWECDPDVCKSCNCGPYLFIPPEKPAPDDEFDEDIEEPTAEELEEIQKRNEPVAVCSNIHLQRGNYKGLKVGISNVAGYGCFLDDTADKGEFIAEYTGEVISRWEAERRGRVYDEYKCSYIFALNREQSVDATRFGNHIRFANHSDKHPNCHSQIMIVNGEHRIGIFAKKRIEKGDELLFDYQYDKKWKEQYVPVEITKGGAIKPHKSRHYSPSLHFRKSKKHPNG